MVHLGIEFWDLKYEGEGFEKFRENVENASMHANKMLLVTVEPFIRQGKDYSNMNVFDTGLTVSETSEVIMKLIDGCDGVRREVVTRVLNEALKQFIEFTGSTSQSLN